jgi:hypothetical protein
MLLLWRREKTRTLEKKLAFIDGQLSETEKSVYPLSPLELFIVDSEGNPRELVVLETLPILFPDEVLLRADNKRSPFYPLHLSETLL